MEEDRIDGTTLDSDTGLKGNRIQLVGRQLLSPDATQFAEHLSRDVRAGKAALPRRSFLHSSGYVVMMATMPVFAGGCDTKALVTFILQAIQLVGELVQGDVLIEDPNTRCRIYQMGVDLFEITDTREAQAVGRGLLDFESCKGMPAMVPLEEAELVPEIPGEHLLSSLFQGEEFASDVFSVNM